MSQTTTRIAPLWTTGDVSRYLGVPVQTLYSWRVKGYGPPCKRVGRYLRFRPEDVTTWFEQLCKGNT